MFESVEIILAVIGAVFCLLFLWEIIQIIHDKFKTIEALVDASQDFLVRIKDIEEKIKKGKKK